MISSWDGSQQLPKHRNSIIEKEVNSGEFCVIDPTTHTLHVLNSTAREIWDHCNGKTVFEDLLKDLCAKFEVDEVSAKRDILKTLQGLRSLGLTDDDNQG